MRRIVLPLSLLAFACQSDSTPATTDPDSSGSGDESSSSGSTEPTTTTLSTTEVDSTGPTDSSSSSSEDDDTNEDTIDPDTGPTNVCGDGMITEQEMCEPDDFGKNTCATQGFGEGVLECSNDCLGFNTDGCFTCGNNNIEGPEDCDGPLGNNIDCESEGFTEGEILCDQTTCSYDTSGCSLCGNGVVEGNETCDGADFGGATCASLGFDEGGSLDCEEAEAECGLIVTSCTGGSFTADFETGAFPEQFVLAGNEDWEVDDATPLTGAFSAHSGNISDSENSILRLTVGFSTDGTVAFNHREDADCGDALEFRVDGMAFNEWACNNNLQAASFPIEAGTHTIEWRFQKDNFNSQGGDRVYVDDVVLTNGVAL